ncbi:MAG: sugar phosphate isomerase/epimerase family protein [Fimbriimonadaceae bacterium]
MKPFALQTYTIRDAFREPADAPAAFARTRDIGYTHIQFSGVTSITPAEAAAMARDAGLTIVASHCGYAAATGSPDAVMADAETLGCRDVAVASLPAEFHHEDGFRRAGEALSAAAEAFHRAGFRLSYHNHAFEFARYGTKTGLDLMAEAAGHAPLCWEFDTYWLVHGGCDPVEWLRRFKGRIPLVHLKDRVVLNGKPWGEPVMAEVGYGNLNWVGILGACADGGCEWWIVEQDTCPGDPFDSAKKSLDWLKANAGFLIGT